MKRTTLAMTGVIAFGLGVPIAVPVALAQSPASTPPAATAAAPAAPTAPKLHAAMRSLWHGHIVATRDYALAVHAANKANEKKAADAVVANARAIADAVAGFYGKEAGDGLFKLLGGHWGGVKALTDSAKAKNAGAEDKAVNELATNAGQIAKFLAGANPNWKESDLDAALLAHAGHHKTQVDLMMTNAPKAKQDAAWTDMQHHMDAVADALAGGIAKQFPDKAN
ncbi:MAG: hypothetical protein IT522_13415 [Burkholderiales bacterium]|nr:hypothetical protein [Burkholderiales bacterium]